LNNNLKEFRIINKMTQEDCARKINISLTGFRDIEKNRSIPSVEIAIKIKRILNVKDIEDLFDIDN